MQHIAEWLEEIGLPKYSQRFAENGIDISVLPHLTDQDLKEVGVLLDIGEKCSRPSASLPARMGQSGHLSR